VGKTQKEEVDCEEAKPKEFMVITIAHYFSHKSEFSHRGFQMKPKKHQKGKRRLEDEGGECSTEKSQSQLEN